MSAYSGSWIRLCELVYSEGLVFKYLAQQRIVEFFAALFKRESCVIQIEIFKRKPNAPFIDWENRGLNFPCSLFALSHSLACQKSTAS